MISIITTSFFTGVRFSAIFRDVAWSSKNGHWNIHESLATFHFAKGGVRINWYPDYFTFKSVEFQSPFELDVVFFSQYSGYPFQEIGSYDAWGKETLISWLGFQHTIWNGNGSQTLTLPIGALILIWIFFTAVSIRRKWKKYNHDKRVSRGECVHCRYSVATVKTGVCPECGSSVP